jgi:hypothetical protein
MARASPVSTINQHLWSHRCDHHTQAVHPLGQTFALMSL